MSCIAKTKSHSFPQVEKNRPFHSKRSISQAIDLQAKD